MENMDDCLDNDDSTLARESDLNFAVDNVEKVSGYVDEKKFKRRDDLNEDLNQHEQQSSPSLHADADFRYEISESLPEKSCPATTESDHGSFLETKFSHDRERTQSPFKDNNRYQGEMDELHGTNFINPSSQSKSQTFHNEMGTEDSAHSQESPLAANANQGAGKESDSDMGSPTAASHAGRVKNICSELSQYESIKSSIHEVERDLSDQRTGQSISSPKSYLWDNKSKKDDSPGDHRMPGMYHLGTEFIRRTTGGSISPMTKRQMSISPEGSPAPYHSPSYREHLPSHQGSHDLSYPPRSPSPKISSPPELRKGILPHHLSPTRQTSSTQGRRQRSQNKDSSALKHISASPRSHRSPPRSYHTPPRSHRSPIRRDSYGYQRDYRDRSRSRSPYSRAQHRSTRGRHSPRQRSPYPEYHSHHRSPRRRPWSPPPNRKTGLGKPGRNLFVAGFSFITTERDLERKFSRYGRVRDVRIVRDKRSGDSRGFGFLTLERDEDADAAIRALDETEWNGRIILVEKSKS